MEQGATNNSEAEDTSSYPSPARAWGLVLLLTIAYAVSFVDRQIISLMVGPIKADLQLSETQMGLLQGLMPLRPHQCQALQEKAAQSFWQGRSPRS